MKKHIFILLALILAVSIHANTLSDIFVYDSGVYPRGIAVADLSGDSKNEILVANFGEDTLIGKENDAIPSSSLSLFSSTGGTSLIKTVMSSGVSPRGLDAGDIDGDGNADAVVTNYVDGNIVVFMQRENGISEVDTIAVGRHPVGVAIGDIDGDGSRNKDIAVSVYSDNKITILSKNQNGSWDKTDVIVPGNPTDVIIGDIAGERLIVSANYSAGNISVIKKAGLGFEKVADIKAGGGVCKVEIADVTGDGVNDIVAANFYDNTITVIEYSKGETTQGVVYKLAGLRPNGMAVGDVNGDGLIDVVTANRDSDSVDVLLQKDGVLVLSKTYNVTEDEVKTYGPVEVVIADVNGDGLADISFTHMRSNTLRVIYQELPKAPVISSSTHPDEEKWYGNTSPVVILEAGYDMNEVEGFYYTISKEEVLFDLSKAELSVSGEIKKDNLETGTWTVNAVVKDSVGNISAIAEFKLNITEEMSEKNVYNYPNPAKDSTTIRFPMAEQKDVKIVVYDGKGTLVWHLEIPSSDVIVGVNYIKWNLANDVGNQIANGVYICKVIAGDKVITKKIAIVK